MFCVYACVCTRVCACVCIVIIYIVVRIIFIIIIYYMETQLLQAPLCTLAECSHGSTAMLHKLYCAQRQNGVVRLLGKPQVAGVIVG